MNKKTQPATVPAMLREAATVYEQRALVYGDNYKLFGSVMVAMFPEGLSIEDEVDWNRIGIFVQVMSKLTRYANQFEQGGHEDSLIDLAVYATMLRELDQMAREEK